MSTSTDLAAVSNTFLDFAHVAEQVRATSKRLEKAALLGSYFSRLADDDLRLAARFFSGTPFALRDQRVVNIGRAALMCAVLNVTGADEDHARQRLVAYGDMGDMAEELFAEANRTAGTEPLTLGGIFAVFETIATTSGSLKKVELVTNLLGTCSPLEAKYAVKLLSGDLRIGLREGAVEDAIARAAEVSVGQVQWTNMLTGDIGETALLARHHQLETAKLQLFAPIKFMLASPAADLSEVARQMPEQFAVEDKFDGIRAQAHIAPLRPEDEGAHGQTVGEARVALFSRTLDEITRAFPDLWEPLAQLAGSGGLILDGEIVPVQGDKILPFQDLQKRLGRKTLTDEMLQQVPVAFVAYDALHGDGRVLMNEAWSERRRVLESLPTSDRFRRAESKLFTEVAPLDDEFDAARARGNEGLMTKDPRATYKPGRRGREWLKIKRALATLDVVVTAVETGNGRRNKFLSDYTFAVRASETDDTLLNVGKAYSGLTNAEIEQMSQWFKEHTIQQFAHGKVRTVEPLIVIEVTFDRVQASPRHKSGYALRFPRILRLRTDKPVNEIDTLETVRRLAEE